MTPICDWKEVGTAKVFDIRKILTEAFNRTGVEWHIKGVLNGKGNLYTLSDDTKLISKVFELVSFPIITKALEPHIQKWETEERQTVYPDLTVILHGAAPNKIAIDIKSTYRRDHELVAGFTLGSYTAYLRPPYTKNIRYPYTNYREHWIVGFIYSRVSGVKPEVSHVDKADQVVAPIRDVELVVHEKWRLASDRPGSGNTTNIGSIREVSALREGRGIFTRFGERGRNVFEDYWRNFDRIPPRKYTNIDEYLAWRRKNPVAVVDLFGNKE